jgi:hypothetical protein
MFPVRLRLRPYCSDRAVHGVCSLRTSRTLRSRVQVPLGSLIYVHAFLYCTALHRQKTRIGRSHSKESYGLYKRIHLRMLKKPTRTVAAEFLTPLRIYSHVTSWANQLPRAGA